jgi:hypothetical protein
MRPPRIYCWKTSSVIQHYLSTDFINTRSLFDQYHDDAKNGQWLVRQGDENARVGVMAARRAADEQGGLTFMDAGARAVISLFMRSAMPGNIVVPGQTAQSNICPTHPLWAEHANQDKLQYILFKAD